MNQLQGYLAPLMAGMACVMFVALPILIRKVAPAVDARGDAWRDQLPLFLRVLHPLVKAYAYTVDSGLSSFKRDLVQDRLNAAGAGYLLTPAEFLVVRRVAFLLCLALALYVVFILDVQDTLYLILIACLVPLGYFYPDLWLRDTTKKRHMRFEKDFPFFLDVLVLGMKAGLTFPAAIEQAVDQSREGPVKQEFFRFLRETRTGVTRRVALDRLAARVLMPAVTNFVASVAQAEETGGSLGDVLADQARQRRQERFLRAEKLANQAPVKMLFPLIALLFPVTFIILFFPIVMQLIESGTMDILRR